MNRHGIKNGVRGSKELALIEATSEREAVTVSLGLRASHPAIFMRQNYRDRAGAFVPASGALVAIELSRLGDLIDALTEAKREARALGLTNRQGLDPEIARLAHA